MMMPERKQRLPRAQDCRLAMFTMLMQLCRQQGMLVTTLAAASTDLWCCVHYGALMLPLTIAG